MGVLVEVCTDSAAGAAAAEAAGAQRIELCASLVEGGVTPSAGAIALACRALNAAKLMVLVRPRGGDFVFDELEMEVCLFAVIARWELQLRISAWLPVKESSSSASH